MPGLPMYEEALDQAGEAISLMMAQYSRKQSVNWKHVMQLTDQIMPIHRVGAPDTARLLIVFNKIYDWVANASDHKDSSNIRFTTPQKRQNFGALLATAAQLVNAARAGYEDAPGLKDGIGGGGRSRKATDDTDIYLRILKEGGDELLGMANAIHDGADRTALDGMVMRLHSLTLKLGMVIDRLNPAGAKPNYPDARYAHQYLRRTFDKIQKAPLSTGQAQSLSMELENAGDSLHRLVDEMSKGQAGKSRKATTDGDVAAQGNILSAQISKARQIAHEANIKGKLIILQNARWPIQQAAQIADTLAAQSSGESVSGFAQVKEQLDKADEIIAQAIHAGRMNWGEPMNALYSYLSNAKNLTASARLKTQMSESGTPRPQRSRRQNLLG